MRRSGTAFPPCSSVSPIGTSGIPRRIVRASMGRHTDHDEHAQHVQQPSPRYEVRVVSASMTVDIVGEPGG